MVSLGERFDAGGAGEGATVAELAFWFAVLLAQEEERKQKLDIASVRTKISFINLNFRVLGFTMVKKYNRKKEKNNYGQII